MPKVKSTLETKSRVVKFDNKAFDIQSYDVDNCYPQRVIDIINDSGTAKSCLRLHAKFVFGGGLKDKTFYKAKINRKGLTVDKFARKQIRNWTHFNALVAHINYNQFGEPVEVNHIPFEYLRLVSEDSKEHAGKIAIYDDWDSRKRKKIDKEKIKYIDIYNRSKVIEQINAVDGIDNYQGQIVFWTNEGLEYPIAPFDPVLEDMQTEAQTKYFKNSTASSNFLASHIIVTGKSEQGVYDDDYNHDSDEPHRHRHEPENQVATHLKEMQGGVNAGRMMVVERENEGDTIDIQKLDLQNYDGLYEYTENSSRDAIIKIFNIPPVLLLRTSGSLGTSKEIADATEYYNTITSDDRLILEEFFTEIFTGFYPVINDTNDYSILPIKVVKAIDPAYLQYYTKNEIREANGDQAADDSKSDTTLLAVTLGVGGTQGLTTLLSDPLLSIDQKRGTMIVLFGLSEQQANTMLGI